MLWVIFEQLTLLANIREQFLSHGDNAWAALNRRILCPVVEARISIIKEEECSPLDLKGLNRQE